MRITTMLLSVVLVGAAMLASASGQQGQPAASYTTVAVVNMTLIFEKAQKVQDLQRIFGQEKIKLEKKSDSRKEKIMLLQKELDSGAFAQDGPDYQDRLSKLERENLELELDLRKWNRRLMNDRKKYFEEIYLEVSRACQDVALSNGIDIVLSDNPIAFDVPDAPALVNQILQKKVVYASPRTDMTMTVLERLDNEYLRKGGAATIKLAK